MREIKFKALFENQRTGIRTWFYVGVGDKVMPGSRARAAKWLQDSGLKGDNGREIYEGDIVELTNTYKGMNTKSIVEIAFIDFTFAGKWRDEHSPSGYMYNPLGSYNFPIVTIEVIGNIYENHELLGEHKSKLFATNIEWDKDDNDTIELPETIEIPDWCWRIIFKEDRKKVMEKGEER